MTKIQFSTVVGPDGVIHPPAGVVLPPGRIDVLVSQEASKPIDPWATSREILRQLSSSGRKFSESAELLREDRDR